MTLKVGIVNFINTAPFYEPWKDIGTPEGWSTVEGAPSRLNTLLKEGKIDAGLVSSFTYGEHPNDLVILRDISISAKGPVKSVLLLSPFDIRGLGQDKGPTTIIVTPKSATSVMLLRIILEVFHSKEYGRDFVFRQGGFSQAEHHGLPYLSIGDEALTLAKVHNFGHVYDLAEHWIDKTGLPFVFAIMAVRKEVAKRFPERLKALYEHIRHCRELGLKRLVEIGSEVSKRIPMTPSECLCYLEGIDYDLSKRNEQGLIQYYTYLNELGVILKTPCLKFFPEKSNYS